MIAGPILIVLGLALLYAGWSAWSGAWRGWAAVRGFPVFNGPISTFPGMGVLLVCAGIGTLAGAPAITGIGVLVAIVAVGLDAAGPHWWGPRWYRAGEWPQPADGFGRDLGRYRAAWQHGRDAVDGRLTLRPDAITFVPGAGSSGIGIPWAEVRGARAEAPSTLCIEAGGETRFTLSHPRRAAKRISGIARLRAGDAPAAVPVPAARHGRIEPL
jgi:hypothetical protein